MGAALDGRGDRVPVTGWEGLPPVEPDGSSWPLDLAAKVLDMPERDLRDLVRICGLPPTGTVKVADFRRSGRNPRAYDGAKLVKICEAVRKLALEL